MATPETTRDTIAELRHALSAESTNTGERIMPSTPPALMIADRWLIAYEKKKLHAPENRSDFARRLGQTIAVLSAELAELHRLDAYACNAELLDMADDICASAGDVKSAIDTLSVRYSDCLLPRFTDVIETL